MVRWASRFGVMSGASLWATSVGSDSAWWRTHLFSGSGAVRFSISKVHTFEMVK